MISIEYLRKVLEYSNGKLCWKYDENQRPQWNAQHTGWIAGHVRPRGYSQITFRPNERNGLEKTKYIMVHRIIFAIHHGYWPITVDHINRNPRDNRIENLREATMAEQCQNSGVPKNSTTGYRGITLRHGKYVVRIQANGQRNNIGIFTDLNAAAEAWEKASYYILGKWRPVKISPL